MLLARMFFFIESGKIQGPVYSPDKVLAGTTNKEFVRDFVANLLHNAFPNLQPYVAFIFYLPISPCLGVI